MLIVLAIMALVALPRFFRRQDFDALTFYDETLAAARAQRSLVIVVGNAVVGCVHSWQSHRMRGPHTDRPAGVDRPDV